jgi:hypothetical protein
MHGFSWDMFPCSTLEYVVNSDVIHTVFRCNFALTESSGVPGPYLLHLRFIQFRRVVFCRRGVLLCMVVQSFGLALSFT